MLQKENLQRKVESMQARFENGVKPFVSAILENSLNKPITLGRLKRVMLIGLGVAVGTGVFGDAQHAEAKNSLELEANPQTWSADNLLATNATIESSILRNGGPVIPDPGVTIRELQSAESAQQQETDPVWSIESVLSAQLTANEIEGLSRITPESLKKALSYTLVGEIPTGDAGFITPDPSSSLAEITNQMVMQASKRNITKDNAQELLFVYKSADGQTTQTTAAIRLNTDVQVNPDFKLKQGSLAVMTEKGLRYLEIFPRSINGVPVTTDEIGIRQMDQETFDRLTGLGLTPVSIGSLYEGQFDKDGVLLIALTQDGAFQLFSNETGLPLNPNTKLPMPAIETKTPQEFVLSSVDKLGPQRPGEFEAITTSDGHTVNLVKENGQQFLLYDNKKTPTSKLILTISPVEGRDPGITFDEKNRMFVTGYFLESKQTEGMLHLDKGYFVYDLTIFSFLVINPSNKLVIINEVHTANGVIGYTSDGQTITGTRTPEVIEKHLEEGDLALGWIEGMKNEQEFKEEYLRSQPEISWETEGIMLYGLLKKSDPEAVYKNFLNGISMTPDQAPLLLMGISNNRTSNP